MVNELMDKKDIKEMIHDVRGKQVMLDSDVAYLFEYEVKQLNRQVNRNKERFPENYCFKLTREEYDSLRCQNGTSSYNTYGGRRYLPYVFTEYGITMLAGLLKSDIAVQASIKIVNQFIEMKKIFKGSDLYKSMVTFENKVNDKFLEYDDKFDYLFSELNNGNFKSKLFFDGEIFDAYDLIVKIIKKAHKNIVIIDNYLDDNVLNILSKKNENVDVLLLTSDRGKINELDINKFNRQYSFLSIKYINTFHDRFIIIDNDELYHLGTSLNYLGSKVFAINKIEDKEILDNLKSKIAV